VPVVVVPVVVVPVVVVPVVVVPVVVVASGVSLATWATIVTVPVQPPA